MALNFTILNKRKKTALALLFVALLVSVFFVTHLAGNKKKPIDRQATVVVAVKKPIVQSYFFHGEIKPIESSPVLSPINGVVKSIYFNYGAKVTKGQKLFALSSKSLRDKFNDDLDSFLQKKDAYNVERQNFNGTQELYNQGAMSKSEFISAQSSYNGAQLAFVEAKMELEKVLSKVNIDPTQVENMKLQDDEKIKTLFRDKFSNVVVTAPASGVALFPLPTESKDGEQLQKAQVGTDIKESQLLLSIGDLSGFRADLKVNEIQVNKIKSGQPVTITGEGFPGIVLKGEVERVAEQASLDNSSDVPSLFDVTVNAPLVSSSDRKIIHVGMTCQVQMDTKSSPKIVLPMAAIAHSLTGGATVDVVSKSGKKTVSVVTGITTPSGVVEIVSGIKSGDKVYVYH